MKTGSEKSNFGRLIAGLLFSVFIQACTDPDELKLQPFEVVEPPIDTSVVQTPPPTPKPVPLITEDSLREGMLRVDPNGASVLLGGGRMQVHLDYPYSLGIHEVTCREYKEYAHELDGYHLDSCEWDWPVVSVSYYDAVLFANAYSKAHGYDTAYTYHRRLLNSKERCTNLEGLELQTDVEGFRLPTEAEWVMAASQSWNPELYGWSSMNAYFSLHTVCAFPDSVGFCDLAGNVIELTNDWVGGSGSASVHNYMGPPTGNSLLEKVVKGGHLFQVPAEINLDNRSDAYPVTASTNGGYMGFRLAFGKIPNPVWMDGNGVAPSSPVTMKSFSSDFRGKFGTVHAKLAFRNDRTGNLAFVDYGGGVPSVVEIVDSIPVFHPEISPNGNRVAFCTGTEGIDGESAVYVRNLDARGGGLVKLNVKNAAIPRWHVDENGDTSIVYVDRTGDNSDDAEFFASATWMVPFVNGEFGTPKKVLNGAYHSGLSQKKDRAVSGARRLRVHVGGKDEIWYGGEQACNASLSKDGMNQTLFLDFGGNTGREFANTKYGVHERLLVADSSGNLVHAIPAPNGYAFDHSEWSGRENWAVASLVNVNGEHTKLVLVNVLDSSVVELAEGEDLWHPNLWVMPQIASGDGFLDLDSAGMYWDPIYQSGEKPAALKMRMFWDRRDSLEVIAVGSSRTERGFDPRQISKPTLNFGFIGGDMWAELYVADNYVVPHAKKLKYLILEISFELMRNDKSARMQSVFEQASGYFYDRNHNFWKDGVPENFMQAVDANVRYTSDDSLNYVETHGLLRIDAYGWRDDVELKRDSIMADYLNRRYEESIDSLTAFIDSTKNKGFKIIGLIYPQSPKYAETGSYGRHGIQRSVVMKTMAYLDSLSEVYPHFMVMDENKYGAHDYTDSMANDYDHLAAAGAEHLSIRVDSLLKTLEKLYLKHE